MSVPDVSPALKSLEQLDTAINTDRSLVAKALGLLLLGQDVDEYKEEEVKDPTEILLRGRVEPPDS